jgi:hypothetical protein
VAPRAGSGIIGVTDTDLAEAQRIHRFREAFYSRLDGVALRTHHPATGGDEDAAQGTQA